MRINEFLNELLPLIYSARNIWLSPGGKSCSLVVIAFPFCFDWTSTWNQFNLSHRSRPWPLLDILRNPLWWLVAASSAAAHLLFRIKEKTPRQLQVHPRQTPTHAFRTHPHTLTLVSIKLIFEKKTGFISETNGALLTNANFHVSLIHLPCYSTWHFNSVIMIPQGNENDIRVTNTIFPSVYQPGELMESNVQLPL